MLMCNGNYIYKNYTFIGIRVARGRVSSISWLYGEAGRQGGLQNLLLLNR